MKASYTVSEQKIDLRKTPATPFSISLAVGFFGLVFLISGILCAVDIMPMSTPEDKTHYLIIAFCFAGVILGGVTAALILSFRHYRKVHLIFEPSGIRSEGKKKDYQIPKEKIRSVSLTGYRFFFFSYGYGFRIASDQGYLTEESFSLRKKDVLLLRKKIPEITGIEVKDK
jgi:hypothetical protein